MREVGELRLNIGSVSFQAGQRSLNTRVYQRLIHEAIAIATGSWGWGPLSIHRFCPPIALSWRSSVKHINAIARATSRASFRRFFKHIILIISKTYQRDDVRERDKQHDHFQNCYTFVAPVVAPHVSHWTGHHVGLRVGVWTVRRFSRQSLVA